MTNFFGNLFNKQSSAEDWFKSARNKHLDNDEEGAIRDLNKAIEIDSNYASAYYLRGSAKYGLCDYQGALDDCNIIWPITTQALSPGQPL